MTLTLLLQASNGVPALALAQNEKLVFDSSKDPELAGSRAYRAVLETGLERAGLALTDLSLIACDIGPGGLGVTRTAAAFANGLGFALGLPVLALPAFELLGAEVAADGPVALLRKAARPYVHFGLYEAGKLVSYEHCMANKALSTLEKLDNYDLAGNIEVAGHTPPATNMASMETMLKLAHSAPRPTPDARAHPIVEVLE